MCAIQELKGIQQSDNTNTKLTITKYLEKQKPS